MAMDRAEFETDLQREGYELREGVHEEHTEAHGVRYRAGRRPAAKIAAAE
jgi:hypothetical protein